MLNLPLLSTSVFSLPIALILLTGFWYGLIYWSDRDLRRRKMANDKYPKALPREVNRLLEMDEDQRN